MAWSVIIIDLPLNYETSVYELGKALFFHDRCSGFFYVNCKLDLQPIWYLQYTALYYS